MCEGVWMGWVAWGSFFRARRLGIRERWGPECVLEELVNGIEGCIKLVLYYGKFKSEA